MKNLILLFIPLALHNIANGQDIKNEKSSVEKIIFVSGGMSNESRVFIKYVADLTKKTNPKICFVPTASADNSYNMVTWYANCVDLPVRPYVIRTFLNSPPSQQTFEESIMTMDAIMVGGGNPLIKLGIWRNKGITPLLTKAK